MTLNIELAEQVLTAITEKPKNHDQYDWRRHDEEAPGCGTTMCIAGWAGYLAGGKWGSDKPDDFLFDEFLAEPGDHPDKVCTHQGVRYVGAGTRGQRVLGLSEERAEELFMRCNNDEAIAMLRRTIRSAKAARTRRGDA